MGVPGFQPELSSPSMRQDHQIDARLRDRLFERQELAARVPRAWHLVFWLSVRRCASPVPSARCQYRFGVDLSAARRSERDPAAVGGPHRFASARIGRQARERVPRHS